MPGREQQKHTQYYALAVIKEGLTLPTNKILRHKSGPSFLNKYKPSSKVNLSKHPSKLALFQNICFFDSIFFYRV